MQMRQNGKGFAEIPDIFFHKIGVISSANQFQMRDSCFLQLIQGTKTASTFSAEISGFVVSIFVDFRKEREGMLLDLVTGFHSSNPIRNLAEITHLIAMKRIAERTRKLTKFIQDKGFELQVRSM